MVDKKEKKKDEKPKEKEKENVKKEIKEVEETKTETSSVDEIINKNNLHKGLVIMLAGLFLILMASFPYLKNIDSRYIVSSDYKNVKAHSFVFVENTIPEKGTIGMCVIDVFHYPKMCSLVEKKVNEENKEQYIVEYSENNQMKQKEIFLHYWKGSVNGEKTVSPDNVSIAILLICIGLILSFVGSIFTFKKGLVI